MKKTLLAIILTLAVSLSDGAGLGIRANEMPTVPDVSYTIGTVVISCGYPRTMTVTVYNVDGVVSSWWYTDEVSHPVAVISGPGKEIDSVSYVLPNGSVHLFDSREAAEAGLYLSPCDVQAAYSRIKRLSF